MQFMTSQDGILNLEATKAVDYYKSRRNLELRSDVGGCSHARLQPTPNSSRAEY